MAIFQSFFKDLFCARLRADLALAVCLLSLSLRLLRSNWIFLALGWHGGQYLADLQGVLNSAPQRVQILVTKVSGLPQYEKPLWGISL